MRRNILRVVHALLPALYTCNAHSFGACSAYVCERQLCVLGAVLFNEGMQFP